MSTRTTHPPADDVVARIGAALAPVLVALIRDAVREHLRSAEDADPWLPHPKWPCASRRAACALARSGALRGVRRIGQGRGALYLVRRSVLDAWIEAHPVAASEHDDGYEREMAQRGLVTGAATRRAGATRSTNATGQGKRHEHE
jgi:hypothetical protein